MPSWQLYGADHYKHQQPSLSNSGKLLYKLKKIDDDTEYFVMYKGDVEELRINGKSNGYDVTEGPFPEGKKATHTLQDYYDNGEDKEVFWLEPIRGGGRRLSKKRPTARRRRSSKARKSRKARKTRTTRRR